MSLSRPFSALLGRAPVDLADRVVLVTGGARGIGAATARALAGRGCRVAVGDLDGELAALEASVLPGGPHHAGALDVRDPADFHRFVEETESAVGPVDVLVNNAGVLFTGPFAESAIESSYRMIDVNVRGVVTGCRVALEAMLPRGRGQIVNVASAAGRTGVGGEAVYAATKHAVVGLGRSLRLELHASGVQVTALLPGPVETELAAGTATARGLPWITAEDVAAAVVAVIERPVAERAVPGRLGPLLWFQDLLPAVARDVLARALGADRIGLDADAEARRRYHDRSDSRVEHRD